jgi:hypothetical protein
LSHSIWRSAGYPVLQDYEAYKQTFAYIERLGLPESDADRILDRNGARAI